MTPENSMKDSVIAYCAAIGADPLLVQGAGGNASWKDGDTLWIKASGTWLSDAAANDIFVPVDLKHLRQEIDAGNFNVLPNLQNESSLRPSIETILHALMPQPVVIHLHAIEILAHLVRREYEQSFSSTLNPKIRWINIAYFKPGAELARAVWAKLSSSPDTNVVFLQNHGVVIGGTDIEAISKTLKLLIDDSRTNPRTCTNRDYPQFDIKINDLKSYVPVPDIAVHQLAIDKILFDRLSSDWVLYPDHIVFLGAKAQVFESIDDLKESLLSWVVLTDLVFVRGTGVFVHPEFSMAKHAQLRCYYDVLSRQEEGTVLNSLNDNQIANLLNWDAEKYRMNMTK